MGTKTILQLVNDALGERGFSQLSSLVGNTDTDAIQILRCAEREGESLAENIPVWEQLVSEHSFSLVAGTQTYALPSDYRWMLPATQWDRTTRRPMQGPLTSSEWQSFQAWTTGTGLNYRFRIRAGVFEVEQDVTVTDSIYYEYVSKNWVMSNAGSGATRDRQTFASDNDLQCFDDELFSLGVLIRFSLKKGFDVASDMAEYAGMRERKATRSKGISNLYMSGRKRSYLYANVPDQNLGS